MFSYLKETQKKELAQLIRLELFGVTKRNIQ